MTRARIAPLLFVLALAACAQEEPAAPSGGEETSGTQGGAEATLVTGDGSDICFETADLPAGYLPVAGDDNTSNALDNVFADEAISARAQDALAASWLVLPQGGASLDERTADCVVYVFEDEDIDDIYSWYVDGYPERQAPEPTEEPVPATVGEDPRLFHFAASEYSGRESFTYVFRFRNVIVSVGADAAEGEVTANDTVPLAEAALANLEAATAG